MAFKATKQQSQAINTDGSVLVAAAAGSGKTAVLVERVIRKLTAEENPVSADRLLIVTFTNAAAAEMRSRIEKRLLEECRKRPDDALLRRQRRLIQTAQICTIDSFCINLVRDNFERVGVQPDFKMADNSSLLLIEREVMAEVIGGYLEENSDDFRSLLELTGCEYDESRLTDAVNRLYLYSRQMPFPDNFLSNLKSPYEVPFNSEHIWYKTAFETAKNLTQGIAGDIEKMSTLAALTVKGTQKFCEYAETAWLMIEELRRCIGLNDWDKLYELLATASFPRSPNTDKTDAASLGFSACKKNAAEKLDRLKSLFALPVVEIEANNRTLRPIIGLLIEITAQYGKSLFDAFCRENILTFYNTEQLALSLLCEYKDGCAVIRDDAAAFLDRYDEVLVDEFQDVNDLQDTLFGVLSNREQKLFVVGDVKQSIYGFRGSNPENFIKKKNRYLPIDIAKENDPKKIILSDNFRSRAGVCEYVNFVFSLLLQGQVGSLVYDKDEILSPAAKYPNCSAPAAELLITDCTELGGDADARFTAESRNIASYIRRVMNEGAVIKGEDGELRSANYGDFTVLLRSMSRAGILARELGKAGIPVDYSAESFSQSIEISTFLSLLKVIDNPENDIELLCVMMSPIFGFSAEDLAQIRADFKKGSLYSAVVSAADVGNIKAKIFIDKLAAYRRNAASLEVDSLITSLLYETDYLNIASAMGGGATRRANLLALGDIAKGYCATGRGSIGGFLRYMELIDDRDIKAPDSSDGDRVRVMTMHKSKGLQFPVCIVADLSKAINDSDARDSMIFDEELGVAFRYYDEVTGERIDTLGRKLLSQKSHITNIEEQLRLFYVALTRAENRIVTSVSISKADEKLTKLGGAIDEEYPHITPSWLSGNASIGDWVLITALLHPDGEALRRRADTSVPIINTESKLSISFVSNTDDVTVSQSQDSYSADTHLAEKINENIKYVYPYDILRDIQAKSSVSALVGCADDERYLFTARPAFMEKEGISAADRGTAMHRIMQYISLDTAPDIDAEIERLVEWQYITENEAASADKSALGHFFESDVYARITKACSIHREMRFLTELPAITLDPSLKGVADCETVIIQGAVDLCFDEGDGIVVLDFKTDRTNDPVRLRDTYAPQLDIYAKACEKLFSKPVKEKIIYSFSMGREIKI